MEDGHKIKGQTCKHDFDESDSSPLGNVLSFPHSQTFTKVFLNPIPHCRGIVVSTQRQPKVSSWQASHFTSLTANRSMLSTLPIGNNSLFSRLIFSPDKAQTTSRANRGRSPDHPQPHNERSPHLYPPPLHMESCQKTSSNCPLNQVAKSLHHNHNQKRGRGSPCLSSLELLKKPEGVPLTSTKKLAVEIHHFNHFIHLLPRPIFSKTEQRKDQSTWP